TLAAEGWGLDISKTGVGIECPRELKPGALVYIEARDGTIEGDAIVVHCTPRGGKYQVGFELREAAENLDWTPVGDKAEGKPDYYDVLQISPKAEAQTIH